LFVICLLVSVCADEELTEFYKVYKPGETFLSTRHSERSRVKRDEAEECSNVMKGHSDEISFVIIFIVFKENNTGQNL
jgi:hypothetical protein